MTSQYYITIQGSRQLRDKLGRFTYAVDAEAQSTLEDVANEAVKEARENAPKDLGAGAAGIHAEIHTLSVDVVSDKDYMMVQEFGRTMGARQPSTTQVAGWGSRHGFDSKQSLFLLARSIGRRGFYGKEFMTRAARNADIMVKQRLALASANLIAWWEVSSFVEEDEEEF